MTDRTTLAETLTHVFAKFENNLPTTSGATLFQSWTAVFGGEGRSSMDVVSSISLVYASLIRLERQINASRKLKDVQKKSALQTVAQFKTLFEFSRFHEGALAFRNNCSETSRGQLGLIGHSLASEFSEPPIQEPDANYLRSMLLDVKNILRETSIDLDLKVNLARHVDAMLWWLEHPEMTSMQDLFETLGSAMVVATQLRERDPNRDSNENSPCRSLFEKISAVAERMAGLLGVANRAVGSLEQISSGASNIINIIGRSG